MDPMGFLNNKTLIISPSTHHDSDGCSRDTPATVMYEGPKPWNISEDPAAPA